MIGRKQTVAVLTLLAVPLAVVLLAVQEPATARAPFTFAVTCDMRAFTGPGAYDASRYFKGAVEAIQQHSGTAFMVSPGDVDPPAAALWTITSTLGADYLWYPVVGNHELPGLGTEDYEGANMDWLRAYDTDANGPGTPPNIVNTGPPGCPETTYSFDYGSAHFVVLNEYCHQAGDTASDADVRDHLYDWLVSDLQVTTQDHIFVFGHECAFPQPDADNGRERHIGDSLDQYPAHRDRFWRLLQDEGVVAFICGHTHNYSAVLVRGVWQLDGGHARGAGDTGAPSTFLLIQVDGTEVSFEAYRDEHDDPDHYDYNDILHTSLLRPWRVFLSRVSVCGDCP